MVFGIITRKEFEERFKQLYGHIMEGVEKKLIEPAIKKLGETISGRESELGDAATKEELEGAIKGLETQLGGYEERLEASQRTAGIVSGAIKPKGDVTFDDVQSLATEISDKAYQRIRDYFLLEMAKKGCEDKKPDFYIIEEDSYLRLEFLVTDQNRIPRGLERRYESYTYIRFIPKLIMDSHDNEKALLSGQSRNSQEYFLLRVSGSSGQAKSDWAKSLRDELPQMLHAYMLGYCLRCLEHNDHEAMLEVQRTYPELKDNATLLGRMEEIMSQDPNLANVFVTHYGRAESKE